MNKTSTYLRGVFFVCVLAAFSLTAQAQTQYSGWLKDYSGLESYQDSQGTTFMRKVDPSFNPQNYKAVLIDKVVFYPAPQPGDKVTEKTLQDIARFADSHLRASLDPKVKIVDKPGPGVARLRAAVTGTAVEKAGLEPYQYIPIAFLLTTAKRAASGTPQQIKLAIETEVTDSVSGQPLLISVREGKGDAFDGDKADVETVKAVLRNWMTGALDELPKFVAPK